MCCVSCLFLEFAADLAVPRITRKKLAAGWQWVNGAIENIWLVVHWLVSDFGIDEAGEAAVHCYLPLAWMAIRS